MIFKLMSFQTGRGPAVRYWVGGFLLSVLLLSSLSGCKFWKAAPKPNFVVILIDTLRPDFLEAYGYPEQTAPFIARLAETSAVFEQAYSTSSWTAPAVSSLFTSNYPHQHGVVQGFFAYKIRKQSIAEQAITINRLPSDITTLPEIFKQLSYTTFGVAANVNLGSEIGFKRGFDHYVHERRLPAKLFLEQVKKWQPELDQANPFFLYLHFNDVHGPYKKRKAYFREPDDPKDYLRAKYISEIGYVDEYLGKIYELLKKKENTIFVLVSDHGEEFFEHGQKGHGFKLYNELTHVLMIFHALNGRIKPQRIKVNTSLVDVLPTLIDLAGEKSRPKMKGLSLKPILENNDQAPMLLQTLRERVLFAHRYMSINQRHVWAAFDRNYYLIERSKHEDELYDVNKDKKQRDNIYSKNQKQATDLHLELQRFKAQDHREKTEEIEIAVDDKLNKHLQSLGYVQ
ncbi:sulfatase [candidate division CSSED10-310 bacterium]|uniref:Sulfatase n=1 Tax=candidate division CSSED10-310 bacterium TaxID=2855610 RepID=A0ABV6Z2P7_UNCC1